MLQEKLKDSDKKRSMYVTRSSSEISKRSLAEVPEGPNLGFLLIKDVGTKFLRGVCTKAVPCCFGFCVRYVPISPAILIYNNQNYTLRHMTFRKSIILIPVLNQPLSSSRFYAIAGEGRYKGEAFSCRKNIKEKKITVDMPKPLNPQNIYQQVEIFRSAYLYEAKSVASDGSNPYIYDCKEWCLDFSPPHHFELSEARGIDSTLRARLPKLDCSLPSKCTKPVIVGKWYCPFMFVREGRIRDQVERSMYYEVTLEQRWEQVFRCKKSSDESSPVTFEVEKEEVFIAGTCKAMCSEKNVAEDGIIWFTSCGTELGGCSGLGLRVEVVERMKWEQERGGWKNEKDFKVSVKIDQKLKRKEEWNEFGCYVLVERFNFRRMDGTLALAYDFKHTHQIKTIWE